MADTKDPYEVLHLARDAPLDAVKAAWRKLARENHPDAVPDKSRAGQDAAADRVADINIAYGILSHADKRKAYDEGESDLSRDELLEKAIDLAMRGAEGDAENVERLIRQHNFTDDEFAAGLNRRVEQSVQREREHERRIAERRQEPPPPPIEVDLLPILNALRAGRSLKTNAAALAAVVDDDPGTGVVALRQLNADLFTNSEVGLLADALGRACPNEFFGVVRPYFISAFNDRNHVRYFAERLARIVGDDRSMAQSIGEAVAPNIVITSPATPLHNKLWELIPASYSAIIFPAAMSAVRRNGITTQNGKILAQIVQGFPARGFFLGNDIRPDALEAKEALPLREALSADQPFYDLLPEINAGRDLQASFAALLRMTRERPAHRHATIEILNADALIRPEAAAIANRLFTDHAAEFSQKVHTALVNKVNSGGENVQFNIAWLGRIVESVQDRSELVLRDLNAARLASGELMPLDQMLLVRHMPEFAQKTLIAFAANINGKRLGEKASDLLCRLIEIDPPTATWLLRNTLATGLRSVQRLSVGQVFQTEPYADHYTFRIASLSDKIWRIAADLFSGRFLPIWTSRPRPKDPVAAPRNE